MLAFKMIVVYEGHTLWLSFPKQGMRGAFKRMYPNATYRHDRGRALEATEDNIWETRLYIARYFQDFVPLWNEFMK